MLDGGVKPIPAHNSDYIDNLLYSFIFSYIYELLILLTLNLVSLCSINTILGQKREHRPKVLQSLSEQDYVA
jgi:hypothetical protein